MNSTSNGGQKTFKRTFNEPKDEDLQQALSGRSSINYKSKIFKVKNSKVKNSTSSVPILESDIHPRQKLKS